MHYDQCRRKRLFEAARRSRACAYLADDDHGPLALQEIPLAGCPTVGVRTGASFVRHGVTGYLVDRLPPGRQCVASDDDEETLDIYLDAVGQAQSLSRQEVRWQAVRDFSTERTIDLLMEVLEASRSPRLPASPYPQAKRRSPTTALRWTSRSNTRLAAADLANSLD